MKAPGNGPLYFVLHHIRSNHLLLTQTCSIVEIHSTKFSFLYSRWFRNQCPNDFYANLFVLKKLILRFNARRTSRHWISFLIKEKFVSNSPLTYFKRSEKNTRIFSLKIGILHTRHYKTLRLLHSILLSWTTAQQKLKTKKLFSFYDAWVRISMVNSNFLVTPTN